MVAMNSARPLYACLALVAVCLSGCGGIATSQVEGKVTHDGVPLKGGSVTFVPETPPPTPMPLVVGTIGEDGTYTLITGDVPGAPVGAYKVVVTSSVPMNPGDPYSLPKSIIPAKYGKAETTDLRVDVVSDAAPGAYDLTLVGKP
jgi:hypothetical protein